MCLFVACCVSPVMWYVYAVRCCVLFVGCGLVLLSTVRGMLAASCTLIDVCWLWLCGVRCLLFVGWSVAVRCLLFVARRLPPLVVSCLLLVVRCLRLLFVVRGVLFVVCWLLFVVCCWLLRCG